MYQYYFDRYTNEGCIEPEKKAVKRLCMAFDVYFKEDLSTSKKSNAIHNFSLLKKICFNLIKLDDSVKRKEVNKRMMYYNHNLDNLKRLIFEIYPNTNQI